MVKGFFVIVFLQCVSVVLQAVPPKEIPNTLLSDFTLNGQINVAYRYIDDSYPPQHPLVYEYDQVENLKAKALRKQENYYMETDSYLYCALDKYKSFIEGKKVAILGSIVPWYESVILAYGGSPVTIEYNKILCKHPDIRVMTVDEFDKNPETFDAILSISSFEHDGLGRYGDPINPVGDLLAMGKAKKMLRAGGLLFLAVPVGRDTLVWNAHRIYGKKRLALLLTGWNLIEAIGLDESCFYSNDPKYNYDGSMQPLFVLRASEN